MTKKPSKQNLILLILCTVVFLAYGVCIWLLDKDDVCHVYNNPILTDSAIYTTTAPGDTIELSLLSSCDETVSGITILPVNVSPSGTGSINIKIDQAGRSTIFTKIDEKDLKVGRWNRVPVELSLGPNQSVKVTLTMVDCSPYFMYAPDNNVTDSDISVGTYKNFVNSVNFMVMLAKYAVLLIAYLIVFVMLLTGATGFADKIGNDLFLVLVFVFICVGIYSSAYKNGIFITADSAGYLREAVNLRAGNGFAYDAMAGYRSWFANWPILYPLMIAGVMLVSGLDAYLSSKIVTAILILAIIIVFRIKFGKNAWMYSIALLNLGFVQLSYYTWSEIPFILFLMLFAFKLGDIIASIDSDMAKKKDYFMLGLWGVLAFLTRYFGIYVWAVVGGYILLIFVKWVKTKEKKYIRTTVGLTVTAVISGMVSIGYLFLNKIMNGMPSGVSRTTWWDDYRTLTVDLINSLITELFNFFHVDCSRFIGNFGVPVRVAFIIIAIVGIVFWLVSMLRKTGGLYSRSGAILVLGGSYYVIFTVIRYFSSMDTFYFRFFEPASFIVTLGIVMLVLTGAKSFNDGVIVRVIGVILAVLITVGIADYVTTGLTLSDKNYYSIVKKEWDMAYSEVPTKSVVIFSDIDFRSEYYRPDVIFDKITTEDTLDTIKSRFYGSETLVIQREYAESMVECGEYEKSVNDMLTNGLQNNSDGKYLQISLR